MGTNANIIYYPVNRNEINRQDIIRQIQAKAC